VNNGFMGSTSTVNPEAVIRFQDALASWPLVCAWYPEFQSWGRCSDLHERLSRNGVQHPSIDYGLIFHGYAKEGRVFIVAGQEVIDLKPHEGDEFELVARKGTVPSTCKIVQFERTGGVDHEWLILDNLPADAGDC
jgi:hypothetical protein